MTTQQFGGAWTEKKLQALEQYLKAYLQIFLRNRAAQFYETVYVDAFAGTGYMERRKRSVPLDVPRLDLNLPEVEELAKGSARRVLDVQPGFHRYLFIEKSETRCEQLKQLVDEYPGLTDRIRVENAEANSFLRKWCVSENWRKTRALIFLDPFGMQVDWALLQAIAATQAIDLWLLFPLGIGVSRLLTRNQPPPKAWADKLTRVLGTDDWRQFYRSKVVPNLFGDTELEFREADFDDLSAYLVQRLKEIFPGVAENPMPLFNSRNSPMYLLCFATANPRQGQDGTAVKIAQDVLKRLR